MKDDTIHLKCPSCGSPMETPDQQGVSLCSACHTKIIIPFSKASEEQKTLERLKELCNIAINAPNYFDLLKYANEILEIDPGNVDGWIDKAMATSSLSTPNDDHSAEALGYLQRARKLRPDYPRIEQTEKALLNIQFNWYVRLAEEADTKRRETGLIGDPFVGLKYAGDWAIQEMNWYIKAYDIKSDPKVEEAIIFIYNLGIKIRISWGTDVQNVISRIQNSRLKAQQETIRRTATRDASALHEKLKQRQAELAKLKQKKGLFANWDVEDVQKEIRNISAEIERLEKIARGDA